MTVHVLNQGEWPFKHLAAQSSEQTASHGEKKPEYAHIYRQQTGVYFILNESFN